MLQGLGTGIIFTFPTNKLMCTSKGRVVKREGKIQEGQRRDGTEVASGILSKVIKRIRGWSSKRTQSRERRQEKMCSGMHNQEYPIQTRAIFPSTPRDCQGHSGRWLLVTILKKRLEQHRNKRQRDRVQEVLNKSDELGEKFSVDGDKTFPPPGTCAFHPKPSLPCFVFSRA